MNKNNNHEPYHKEKWVAPEITVISGLDSCVEFLYGDEGIPSPDPPPFLNKG